MQLCYTKERSQKCCVGQPMVNLTLQALILRRQCILLSVTSFFFMREREPCRDNDVLGLTKYVCPPTVGD